MLKYLKIIMLIPLWLMLNGCGFSIQSGKTLPSELNGAYLQSNTPFATFEADLKRKLKSHGITLVESPQQAPLIINLNSNYNYNTNNPASSSQARVFDLVYTATISLSNKHKTILKQQKASVTRSITLQPNEVFATTPQVTMAKKEMLKKLTVKIVNILASQKTFQALNMNNTDSNEN